MSRRVYELFGFAFSKERKTIPFWLATIGCFASIGGVLLALKLPPWVGFVFIVFIVFVAGLVILARSYRGALIQSVEEYENLSQQLDNRVYLFQSLANRYGIVKEQYTVTTEIASDGSATATINQIVKAVRSPVEHIDYGYTVPTLSGNVSDEIRMTEKVRIPGHAISVRPIFSQPQSKFFEIHFEPAIAQGETVPFVLTRLSPKETFTLDPSLLPSDRPFEYSRQRISYPTRLLSLSTFFPSGFRANDVRVEATYGIAGLIHRSETARLLEENCLGYCEESAGILVIRLLVDYPIHGLYYIIKWRPLKSPVPSS